MPSPHTHPEMYKSLIIGDMQTPGTVTLSDFAFEHSWEEQQAKGSTGTTTLNRGRKPGRFTATFYLADLEEMDAWDVVQRRLAASVEGPKPKSMLIVHPDLLRQRVIDFVLVSISGMQHDGKGGATVVCKFLEYRPPKPKPAAKPDAAAPRRGTATVNDPNAQRKAELAALLEQAKRP